MEINKKIDEKLNEFLLKKAIRKNQRKALEAISFSLSSRPVNRSVHPAAPKRNQEPSISKGAVKIKEVEARALQRYMGDRRNGLPRHPRETCPLKSSFIQQEIQNMAMKVETQRNWQTVYQTLQKDYKFPNYKELHYSYVGRGLGEENQHPPQEVDNPHSHAIDFEETPYAMLKNGNIGRIVPQI
jgi:hypothetical protein